MKSRIVTMALCAMAMEAVASSGGIVSTKFEFFLKEEKKIEIKVADLPASVSKALAENHAGAEVLKAYRLEDEQGATIGYEVLLKKESGEQSVRFLTDGEPEK